jgi:hypothetical protein
MQCQTQSMRSPFQYALLVCILVLLNGTTLLTVARDLTSQLKVTSICARPLEYGGACVFGRAVATGPTIATSLNVLLDLRTVAGRGFNAIWSVIKNLYVLNNSLSPTSRLMTSLVLMSVLMFRIILFKIFCWVLAQFGNGIWMLLWPVRFIVYMSFSALALPYYVGKELHERWMLRGLLVPISSLPRPASEEQTTKDILRQILAILRGGYTKEAMQHGSPLIKADEWPAGLVAIRNYTGEHYGFGFIYTKKDGTPILITAAHVLKKVAQGMILSVADKSVRVANDAQVVLASTFDVAGVVLEKAVSSRLGVKKVKVSSVPAESGTVSCFGYVRGEFVRTIGLIESVASRFRFRHTASTLPGFSGTPIFNGDKEVCGIHIEHDGMGFNYALSLEFLVNIKEDADYWRKRHLLRYEDELDGGNEDFILFDGNKRTVRTIKDMYALEDTKDGEAEIWDKIRYNSLSDYGRWTDETEMDFSVPPTFGKEDAGFQSGSETKVTPPLTLSSSASTTGRKRKNKSERKAATTSSSPDASTRPRVEGNQTEMDLSKRNTVSTANSGTGAGHPETSTARSSPSGSTPAASEKENGAQPRPKKKKSSTRSSLQANIRRLERRLASMDTKENTPETTSKSTGSA